MIKLWDMGRLPPSVTFVEHLQYTAHLMCGGGRRGKEDRAVWRDLVLILGLVLFTSGPFYFLSWGYSGFTEAGEGALESNGGGSEVGLGSGGVVSMRGSQEARCSTKSGTGSPFPAPPSCTLCFTKGHAAVMSQPGHRVSQLPQRLPEALRSHPRRGQTPADFCLHC